MRIRLRATFSISSPRSTDYAETTVKAAPLLRLLSGAEFPCEDKALGGLSSSGGTVGDDAHEPANNGDFGIMIPAEVAKPTDSSAAERTGGVER
jgi:para-aminobenzoate synthetase